MSSAWLIERVSGVADDLVSLGLPSPSARLLRWCHVEGDALVLGSTQRESHIDSDRAAAAGPVVVRRRTGGAAVLVEVGKLVWADLIIPVDDPLWDTDVGRATWWVGEAWATALRRLGVHGANVHRGAMVATAWSERVCFAGLGSGEVSIDGRKVVGVSQRRTREAALFQCAALLRWTPRALVAVLAEPRDVAEIERVAVGVAELVPSISAADVEAALELALPVD